MPTLRDELWIAFLAGFWSSGEGHNGEHPLDPWPDSDPEVRKAFEEFLQREGL